MVKKIQKLYALSTCHICFLMNLFSMLISLIVKCGYLQQLPMGSVED